MRDSSTRLPRGITPAALLARELGRGVRGKRPPRHLFCAAKAGREEGEGGTGGGERGRGGGLRLHNAICGHTSAVYCCTFDKSGHLFISGSDDENVKIWSARSGLLRHTLRGHTGEITELAVSPDNIWLVSASNDTTARVWRLADGVPEAVLCGHRMGVNSVSFSPSLMRPWLLSVGQDASVLLWSSEPWESPPITLRACAPLQPAPDAASTSPSASCGALSPTGSLVAVGSNTAPYLHLWHLSRSSEDVRRRCGGRGASGGGSIIDSVVGSGEQSRGGSGGMLGGGSGGMIGGGGRDMNVEGSGAGSRDMIGAGNVRSTNGVVGGESVGGDAVGNGRRSGFFCVASEPTHCRGEEGVRDGHTHEVTNVAFSSCGTRLLSGSRDGSVLVWGVRAVAMGGTGCERLPRLQLQHRLVAGVQKHPAPHLAAIENHVCQRPLKLWVDMIAWSRDDCFIFSSESLRKQTRDENCVSSCLRVWSAKGRLLHTLGGCEHPVFVIQPHPLDPHLFASAGYDGFIRMWDALAGAELAALRAPRHNTAGEPLTENDVLLLDAAWDVDGGQLVAGCISGAVLLAGISEDARIECAPAQQFFSTEQHQLVLDAHGNALDAQTGRAPHLSRGLLCDLNLVPHESTWQKPPENLPLTPRWLESEQSALQRLHDAQLFPSPSPSPSPSYPLALSLPPRSLDPRNRTATDGVVMGPSARRRARGGGGGGTRRRPRAAMADAFFHLPASESEHEMSGSPEWCPAGGSGVDCSSVSSEESEEGVSEGMDVRASMRRRRGGGRRVVEEGESEGERGGRRVGGRRVVDLEESEEERRGRRGRVRRRAVESDEEGADDSADERRELRRAARASRAERRRKRRKRGGGSPSPPRRRLRRASTQPARVDEASEELSEMEVESAPAASSARHAVKVDPAGWLAGTEPARHEYVPQVGDAVVYLRRGHEASLAQLPERHEPPYAAQPWLPLAVGCEVVEVSCVPADRAVSPHMRLSVALSVRECPLGGPAGSGVSTRREARQAAEVWKVTVYAAAAGAVDFLILRDRYEHAARQHQICLESGRCAVGMLWLEGEGERWYDGQVVRVRGTKADLWECLQVQWDSTKERGVDEGDDSAAQLAEECSASATQGSTSDVETVGALDSLSDRHQPHHSQSSNGGEPLAARSLELEECGDWVSPWEVEVHGVAPFVPSRLSEVEAVGIYNALEGVLHTQEVAKLQAVLPPPRLKRNSSDPQPPFRIALPQVLQRLRQGYYRQWAALADDVEQLIKSYLSSPHHDLATRLAPVMRTAISAVADERQSWRSQYKASLMADLEKPSAEDSAGLEGAGAVKIAGLTMEGTVAAEESGLREMMGVELPAEEVGISEGDVLPKQGEGNMNYF
ncbi:MAG: hypothetical protein SGPRY_003137 [Prymnesium sp.]